jgi:hypothetical protein
MTTWPPTVTLPHDLVLPVGGHVGGHRRTGVAKELPDRRRDTCVERNALRNRRESS